MSRINRSNVRCSIESVSAGRNVCHANEREGMIGSWIDGSLFVSGTKRDFRVNRFTRFRAFQASERSPISGLQKRPGSIIGAQYGIDCGVMDVIVFRFWHLIKRNLAREEFSIEWNSILDKSPFSYGGSVSATLPCNYLPVHLPVSFLRLALVIPLFAAKLIG